jgi:hypothetical protein
MLRKHGLFSALALVLVMGCNRTLPPNRELQPVKGKVVLADGTPLRWGTIILHPVGTSNGNEAQGTINSEGVFGIRTYARDRDDGAVEGEYTVTIETYRGPQARPNEVTEVPKKYENPNTSGLTLEIKSGENTPTITLN